MAKDDFTIQIGWTKLYPHDAEKYSVWEITALVVENEGYSFNYKHPLNKKIRRKKAEDMLEGKPLCLIQDGVFVLENFKKENLGGDEFFAELRLKGISHLGQVETAIEETSGELSVFYYADEEIKPGLSVMPGSLNSPLTEIPGGGHYSCTFCAYSEEKTPGSAGSCPNCKREEWVKSSCKKRIT